MRTFIVLLLLANLAYLGWNLRQPAATAPVMVRTPSTQAARTLQLLEEVVPELPAPAQEPVPVPASTPATCISLGVFKNTDESDFLVSALLERGMQARAELLPSGEVVNYRVFMPPFNSDTAARQMLDDLQASGIESFIMTSGDLDGGISLGLFSGEAMALEVQEELAAQGFATSIEQIVTANNEIWVTIQGLSQTLMEGSELLDLLTQGLDLDVIEKPCETFASGP